MQKGFSGYPVSEHQRSDETSYPVDELRLLARMIARNILSQRIDHPQAEPSSNGDETTNEELS
jgi:hypothetical protein